MRLGTVPSGGGVGGPTVYTVLAHTAHARSPRYLTVEAVLACAVGALVLARRPGWWPVASLALSVALYAGWGLWSQRYGAAVSPPARHRLAVLVAALATVATLAGLGGLAVKAFWGTAPGPYGACYRPDGTTYGCHADGSRRPVSRPPT